MIIETKCKKCRRAGEKLFLKGEKCFTPKCVFEKKPFPPGLPLAQRKHRTMLSEYGIQLKEKQKVRNVYRLSERQFRGYVDGATTAKGSSPTEKLYEALELRLDNVAYRLGFAGLSRGKARQVVSHGQVLVNGRRVDIPSYKLRVGDKVSLRPESKDSAFFAGIIEGLEKQSVPSWLSLDVKKLEGTVQGLPKLDKTEMTFNLTSILEFYSR